MATVTPLRSPAERQATGGRATLRRMMRQSWPSIMLVIVAIILWQVVVVVFAIPPFVIAKPSDIAVEFVESSSVLLGATWITTQEIVIGFLISVVVGMAIAIAVVRFGWLERAVYPLIVLFQVVPKVALAPIFILWFGYSIVPKLVLIVVIAFFPITINMVLGLKRADDDLLLLMRSVGSTRSEILARIQIPTALPYLFAGLRIAITLSVIGAVVAEFAGAQDGLGYLIQFASTQLDTSLMFAALIAVSVLGLVLYYAIGLVERLLWRPFPHLAIAKASS